jgi:hypothetical protein
VRGDSSNVPVQDSSQCPLPWRTSRPLKLSRLDFLVAPHTVSRFRIYRLNRPGEQGALCLTRSRARSEMYFKSGTENFAATGLNALVGDGRGAEAIARDQFVNTGCESDERGLVVPLQLPRERGSTSIIAAIFQSDFFPGTPPAELLVTILTQMASKHGMDSRDHLFSRFGRKNTSFRHQRPAISGIRQFSTAVRQVRGGRSALSHEMTCPTKVVRFRLLHGSR